MPLRPSLLAAPFNPTKLGGCRMWLVAERVLGVAEAGGVATWRDYSGYGNSPAQGTGGQQPTYRAGVIGGRPVLRFDGSDDVLTIASNTHINVDRMTAALVFASTQNASDIAMFEKWGGSGAYPYTLRFAAKKPTLIAYDGTDVPSIASATDKNDGLGHLVIGRRDGTNLDLWNDGVRATSVADSAADGTSTNNAALSIGSLLGVANAFAGDLAEVIFYNRALSDGDVLRLQRYLANRYRIAI